MSTAPAPKEAARRLCWFASTAITSLLLPVFTVPAAAQQTASPDIPLDEVVIQTQSPVVTPAPAAPARVSSPQAAPVSVSAPMRTTQAPTAANAAVVVSPTAIPSAESGNATSVTVITGQDIQRDQRRTVPDALSTVPGLNIVQSGGPGGLTSIFMRGTNSNHTKFLLDGIDISDPSNPAKVFDLGQMLTADIARIEVLRGPQSGLYGADAIGGVISVITTKGEGPLKITGQAEGGSFGTFNQISSLSGSDKNFNYAFNVAHFRAASTPVTPAELVPPGVRRPNDSYDNLTYSTKLGLDVTENLTINHVGRFADATLFFQQDENIPTGNQTQQVAHQYFTRTEAVWSLFDGRFTNYFGVNYTDHWRRYANPDSFFPSPFGVFRGERAAYNWRGVASIMPGQTLVTGLMQETERMRVDPGSGEVNAQTGNKAGYVELQSEFAKRFFVVANLRHDQHDVFGGANTYRIAPAFLVPVTDTKLKGSYGTGFKAPTLSQLYDNTFLSANPNLKPEESKGYDAGFEQPLFNERARFGVTYYHNDITNLITGVFNPAVGPFGAFVNTNINKATTEGVEAFGAVRINSQLVVRTDHTTTRAVDAITGLGLLRRPGYKGSISWIWTPNDQLSLSATLLNVSGWRDIDRATFATITQRGYQTINFAANYAVNNNLTMFGRIDNLLNEHYQNPNGFDRPGIGIFGGIRVANR
jgi:vitamin B12 transporter